MQDPARVIRETDADAVRLGKTLVRSARFGALATLDHTNGFPTVSRVGVATDLDGTPVILVSMLAAHTKALLGDARCSLLLGEPGKGDALAYPRISLWCNAERVEATGADAARVRRRYLNRNPKASLYAGLGDFHFFRLCIRAASLNGGFGRAYQLAGGELSAPCLAGLAEIEQSAIDKMNADHPEAIRLCASISQSLNHLSGVSAASTLKAWMSRAGTASDASTTLRSLKRCNSCSRTSPKWLKRRETVIDSADLASTPPL
jgi:putative heme iron utilization protein